MPGLLLVGIDRSSLDREGLGHLMTSNFAEGELALFFVVQEDADGLVLRVDPTEALAVQENLAADGGRHHVNLLAVADVAEIVVVGLAGFELSARNVNRYSVSVRHVATDDVDVLARINSQAVASLIVNGDAVDENLRVDRQVGRADGVGADVDGRARANVGYLDDLTVLELGS